MAFNLKNMYSQNDARWSRKKLGFSNLTIGGYGCAITAVTNLHNSLFDTNITPLETNEKLKAVKAFYGAMLIWERVPLAFPKLKFISRDRNYNNLTIWKWINISPRVPVIGEVWLSRNTPQHFILMVGGGKIVDSIDGKIKQTSSYKEYIGSARYTRS